MKFYDCAGAPSPRRVRIFLAEKGIAVPTVQVDLRHGEQFTDAFRAINPDCTVPVLELDDGTRIADAVGICVYFEALQPAPPLMGSDPTSKALIVAAQRRAERDGFSAVVEAFRNFTPGLKGLRLRRRLQHRRHHHAGDGGFRPKDQARDPGSQCQSAPLV
jgi:glutathione S-transferase